MKCKNCNEETGSDKKPLCRSHFAAMMAEKDKQKKSNVNEYEAVHSRPQPQRTASDNAKIIRQSCLKAAATVITSTKPQNDVLKSVIYLAEAFEVWVNR